ncbi:MAG: hypothetical protein R2783_04885 [Gelidibacter sp.]
MCPEEQTPIYLKAKEIQQLVFSLVALIEESELPDAQEIELDLLEGDLFAMKSFTSEILSGISIGSCSIFPYDMKMESAVIVRKATKSLLSFAYGIEDMGLKDIDYLDLLYEEIEAFRELFVEWVKTFDLWKYDDDNWGLFNPEGIELRKSEFDEEDDGEEDDEDDY